LFELGTELVEEEVLDEARVLSVYSMILLEKGRLTTLAGCGGSRFASASAVRHA
jgi:hypothetical protein